jgi:predicted ATPase
MAAEHGVQVILESHSDHVLNGIRLAVKRQRVSADKVGIWYFYRDEPDQFRVPHLKNPVLDKDGKIREWPDGFFDESEKSLLELL